MELFWKFDQASQLNPSNSLSSKGTQNVCFLQNTKPIRNIINERRYQVQQVTNSTLFILSEFFLFYLNKLVYRQSFYYSSILVIINYRKIICILHDSYSEMRQKKFCMILEVPCSRLKRQS